MAELRWGSATHEGQIRSQNEDHAHADTGLFVVADGMGGHLAGEVASEMAVERLDQRLRADRDSTLDDLVAAITEANVEIYNGSVENPDQAGMGTTVTAIAVVADPHDGEVFGVANVGDSRSYVMRHGRLRQVTVDHSYVQELVAEGAISRDEARTHPRRNIVTRALGIEPSVRVDSWTMPIIRGDRFVLCSDGLVDEITDDAIAELLHAHPDDPGAAAQALVDAANAAGGRDNITVVVVDVLEGDDPPDPTEEFDVIPLWHDGGLDDTGETQIAADEPDEPDGHEPDGAEGGIDVRTPVPTGVLDVDAGSPALAAAVVATGADAPSLYDGGDDVTPVPGAAVPDVDPAPVVAAAPPAGGKKSKRGGRFARFILGLGVAAVLVLGFAIFAAWARDGYYVSFDEAGQVVIYQGKKDGILWFEPTKEATGAYGRDELDDDSVELVDLRPEFESQASAARFVAERLAATTTTTTPPTTTTSIPVIEPTTTVGTSTTTTVAG